MNNVSFVDSQLYLFFNCSPKHFGVQYAPQGGESDAAAGEDVRADLFRGIFSERERSSIRRNPLTATCDDGTLASELENRGEGKNGRGGGGNEIEHRERDNVHPICRIVTPKIAFLFFSFFSRRVLAVEVVVLFSFHIHVLRNP